MLDQAELRRREYTGRINRVMDYVRENLNGDLRLEKLARIANFSPYHFHRVFKAIVGETTNAYIRRHRAQKAACHLVQNSRMSITEIAMACGYSSSSSFAREFRQMYGMSATQFRNGGKSSLDTLRETVQDSSEEGPGIAAPVPLRTEMVFRVEAVRLPERHVAYIRHIGPYNQIGQAFGRLMQWAGSRDLVNPSETVVLAIYHDNPYVTPEPKLRSDACVTVPKGTPIADDIGHMVIPGGLFAVAHVEIDVTQYGEAWDRLMGEWMPQSGYQPDDRLCYEIYLNDSSTHPEHKHIVELCEPIRPL